MLSGRRCSILPRCGRRCPPSSRSSGSTRTRTNWWRSWEVRGFWGRFRGLARVSHVVEGQSYHLRLSGAAAEGTAMAQGAITLHEEEDGVVFRYRGDLTVHGALTRLGGRFIGGSIRILIRDFLQGLTRNLADEPAGEQTG